MLRLICGRSGFGKTHRVMEEIGAWVDGQTEETAHCFLLVPEQFSFETERALIDMLGVDRAGRVQVLSFTRMAQRCLEPCAGAREMSSGAKVMLMNRALTQTADKLTLFSGGVRRTEMIGPLLELAEECRQTAVSPSMLEQTARSLPNGTLRQKTEELSLILETYDALLAVSGSDPQKLVAQLAAWLPESGYLRGASVFADGFKGFTAAELQVLSAAMAQADTVTVTLCTDRLYDDTQGLDRFSTVMETARRLTDAAKKQGCTVEKPVFLMNPHRFENEELSVLEATAFTSEQLSCSQEGAVTLTECRDVYEECTAVVRDIRRLLRRHGMRARKIAVVVRSLSDYDGVLDAALEQAGIPYYLDSRRSIVSQGAVTAVLTALRIATGDWRSELLLQLVKTGLLGFSASSAAQLENYVFIWNISGALFRTEWQAHPDGFSSTFEKADVNRLSHLNRLRRRLIAPLEALEKTLSRPVDGKQLAQAIYTYICDARIDRMTALQIKRLRASGETVPADNTERVWNALMALLDDAADVMAKEKIDGKQAAELLRAAAAATDLGSIPQQLDAVQIGQADRIRFHEPSAVFLLGANEGVFPALPVSGGLLTARERDTLIGAGLPFEEQRERHTSSEQFLAYAALCAASQRVYISYVRTLPDGSKGEPSSICRTVTAHLPFVTVRRAKSEDGADIETAEDAFERLSDGFCAQTPLSRGLYQALWEDGAFCDRLRTMTRVAGDRPITFEHKEAAARFFGDRMVLSATRVEKYYQCRFAYFCRYGLKAEALRAADLGDLEFGTLTHYVMENLLPLYIEEGIQTIPKERCFADARAAADEYVQKEMGGKEGKTGRFLYLLDRLYGVCGNFLWQAVRELSQSSFRPADYELPIDWKNDDPKAVPPLTLQLPDGTQVYMVGKIDRVDVYEENGKAYVRVVDYKTGNTQFSLTDVVEGLNLQMLIYMMTVWKNGRSRYGDVVPAGLLYMPSKAPVISVDGYEQDEKLETKQIKSMRMNGLLIDDERILQAMEPGIKGLFIPARQKIDGGYDKYSSVATLAEFGALGRRAQKLLCDMAKTLRDGDVDALPLIKDKKNPPCDYCDYRAACGHEEEDRCRTPQFNESKEVLDALSKEETE